jgi:hypothetical protein
LRPINFAHIINTTNHIQQFAQKVTIESMQNAQKQSKINVDLYHTAFEDEWNQIDGFKRTASLLKSSQNIQTFKVTRKLPLISDIIANLYDVSDANYFIYTNVDISLMPNFYNQVHQWIEQNYDCLIINRKNIDAKKYTSINQLKEMYKDEGETHVGMDCFVFKRSIVPKMNLQQLLIGVKSVDVGLYINLLCLSEKIHHEKEMKLTFHIGDDGIWTNNKFFDYNKHNKDEIEKIIVKFKQAGLYNPIFKKRQDAEKYIRWKNTIQV